MTSPTRSFRAVLLALLTGACLAACGAPTSEGAPGSGSASASGTGSGSGSGTGSGTGTASATAPPALPAEIRAHVHLPEPDADAHLFVTVRLDGLPWTIAGCVTGPDGACEETQRVELDEADRVALVRLIGEVRAIPLCEREAVRPGDRPYRLELTGTETPYQGHLPADPAELDARNQGPCRADARLATWIAQRFQRRP